MSSLPDPPAGLRWWDPVDVAVLEAAWRDPTITRWNPVPETADASRWIATEPARRAAGQAYDFVVVDAHGDAIGEVGLRNITAQPARAELGFWVAAAARGRGVAVGAIDAICEWAVSIGLEQMWARTDETNEASRATLRRAGFDPLGSGGSPPMEVWGRRLTI